MPEVGHGISKAADKAREGGRNQVIEGPTDHMRDLDSYSMGYPQLERIFFFLPDLRSRWRM